MDIPALICDMERKHCPVLTPVVPVIYLEERPVLGIGRLARPLLNNCKKYNDSPRCAMNNPIAS